MAEEIKNEVENEEETKVKLTLGQRVDKTVDAVKSVPKKIVSGGKKAVVAVGVGLLAAFGAGALAGSKGYFTSEDERPALNENDEAVVVDEASVIDVEPEVVESEEV